LAEHTLGRSPRPAAKIACAWRVRPAPEARAKPKATPAGRPFLKELRPGAPYTARSMISSNDFRNGVTIVIDGHLWTVIEFLHVKPGKGSAFVRTRLKNVKTGATVERTFRAGEKLERATVDNRDMAMLYNDDEGYHFMDSESYENFTLQREVIGDPADFLKDGMRIAVQFHDGVPIGADLPAHVELKVEETDPGFKGDTATGTTKPAKLETGATVQVPLFVNPGDVIKIDTRDRRYIGRVQS
jgi:elongation factor P